MGAGCFLISFITQESFTGPKFSPRSSKSWGRLIKLGSNPGNYFLIYRPVAVAIARYEVYSIGSMRYSHGRSRVPGKFSGDGLVGVSCQ